MSLSGLRSLTAASSRLLSSVRTGLPLVSGRAGAPMCQQGAQMQRGLARSLWHMCNNSSSRHVPTPSLVRPAAFTRSCGCCGLHTQGDKELAEFLAEEIALERKSEKNPGKLPKIMDFELETDDADVSFTKVTDNESVKIKFCINNSVADETPFDYEKPEEDQDVQMVARPPFVVEISKGGELSLCFQCSFPDSNDPSEEPQAQEQQQQEDQFVDILEIQEVALVRKEWEDKSYAVSASVMDGNLYEMLLNMLEERGIDGDFIDKLVEFSTNYEHKKYICFLEQLKDFALSK